MQHLNHEGKKNNQNKTPRSSLVHSLPFIEQNKTTSYNIQQSQHKHHSKKQLLNAEHLLRNQTNKKSNNEQIIFSKLKDISSTNKKLSISPKKKLTLRQKILETVDNSPNIKNKDSKISQKSFSKQQSVFYSLMKNNARQEQKMFKIVNNQPISRAFLYQPYKKRSAANQRDRLRPIISESNINSNDVYFFNVEKIVLQEDRHKKSSSLMISGMGDERQKSYYNRQEKIPNSKLIKQINIIKQKLNIQRVIDLNQQSQFRKGHNLPNIINIKSLDYKTEAINAIENKMLNLDKTQMSQEQTEGSKVFDAANQNYFKKSVSLDQKQKAANLLAKRVRRKFVIPFQTYYYRDLLWKVNFTNSLYVQIPLEYEHRLKVYVGKGNNSCMVSGLITRRFWFSLTDRPEEANFVWTQLKELAYFKKQTKFQQEIPLEQRDKGKYQSQLLLTNIDSLAYRSYFNNHFSSEQHSDQRLISRLKPFKYRKLVRCQDIKEQRLHNHFLNNYVIGNKKALFNTMSNYYNEVNLQVFDYLPLTFHIKDGMEDKKYFQFLKYYHKRAKQIAKTNQQKGRVKQYNAWIVKPGQNSNRGNGIKMCLNLDQIRAVLKKRQRYADGTYRTYIVQAYIERPLLYFKRKFDLRHYILITCINGIVKGYWYKEGYVRTTSSEYSLDSSDGSIHLTNDAVQKNLPDYGKYQKGNKISYDELSAYIQKYHKKKGLNFYQSIYPKMKKIGTDAIKACSGGIDPDKLQNNFEIFGMDFMIDGDLNVWLIQINTNPCLQLSCPLLSSIIPKMVENTLELTMDAMFPPPVRYSPKGVHYLKQLQKQNKFQLVYDQRVQRLYKGSLQVLDNKLLQQEDDTFEDCGEEWEDS